MGIASRPIKEHLVIQRTVHHPRDMWHMYELWHLVWENYVTTHAHATPPAIAAPATPPAPTVPPVPVHEVTHSGRGRGRSPSGQGRGSDNKRTRRETPASGANATPVAGPSRRNQDPNTPRASSKEILEPLGDNRTVPSWISDSVKPLHPFITALRKLCYGSFKDLEPPRLREALHADKAWKDYQTAAQSGVGDYWCIRCKFWGHRESYSGCPKYPKDN